MQYGNRLFNLAQTLDDQQLRKSFMKSVRHGEFWDNLAMDDCLTG